MNLPKQVGNQSEVVVSFVRPPANYGRMVGGSVRFSVQVMASSKAPAPSPTCASEMQGTDLPGNDYSVTHQNYTDFKLCEAACNKDDKCKAWTYVVRPPLHADCCLKSEVPVSRKNPTCTSGCKKQPAPPPTPSG